MYNKTKFGPSSHSASTFNKRSGIGASQITSNWNFGSKGFKGKDEELDLGDGMFAPTEKQDDTLPIIIPPVIK